MSKEGDRQSVLQTTKVRTSLKGDSSWIQRRSEPQSEQQKSWLSEVKATRANGPIAELSPPASPTAASAVTIPSSPTTSQVPKPSSGYLIRGVFTKTDDEKVSASNGTSGPSSTFIKKPTESYKKIAPHIVRSGSSSSTLDDVMLSPEEQDKRTEAASNVLRTSAVRQRSYVLSAAKKYESAEKPQDTGLPFVAKRVVIDDEDDTGRKDNGKDETAPPVVSQQTAVQSVPPSSSKLPVEPKTEITKVKTSPKADTPVSPDTTTQSPKVTQLVTEQKTKKEAAPVSSVESQKVAPASVLAPVVSTSPKDSKPVVEQKTETPTVKSSSVEMPKVTPVAGPAPVVSTSYKDTKQVEEPKKTETPAVKACSAETPKVAPVSVPAPVVSTSPKDSKPVVEQKTETPPVKSSSVETPKVTPAAGPAPVVSTSYKDTKQVEEPKKTETPAVKACSAETPKVAPVSVPAPVVSTSPKDSKPVVEQKTETPPVKSSSVEMPKVTPAAGPAPVVTTSSKDSKQVEEPKKAETPAVKACLKDTKLSVEQKSPAVNSSSVEMPKVTPVSVLAPVISTSPKDSKPVVEQKTETPPVKSSSVEMPKVTLAAGPAPVVSTSSKDTKQVMEQKKTLTPPVKTSSPTKAEQAPDPIKNIDNEDLISLAESGEKFLDPFPSVPESQKSQIDQKTSISLDNLADDVIPFSIRSISTSDSATAKQPSTNQSTTKSMTTTTTSTTENTLIRTSTKVTEQKAGEGCPSNTQTTITSITKTISTGPSSLKEPPKSTDISVMDLFDPFPVDTTKSSKPPASLLKSTEDSFEEDLNDLVEDHENFTITVEKIEPHDPSSSPMDSTLETTSQKATPSDTESKKGIVLLKEYVDTKPAAGISNNDLFSSDYISSSFSSYNYSSPPSYSSETSACTYCGLPVGSEAKITIEHLNISCHPACFKCGVCSKPMGDLLYSMFLHKGVVHCESCYANTI